MEESKCSSGSTLQSDTSAKLK